MTPLTDGEFGRLRALLAEAAGLVFDDSRREALALSVGERLRACGAAGVAAYLDRLDEPAERAALLDEVTVQETHFFRNPPQVAALRTHVLPELRQAARHQRLRVWSAGCSTGEEPYTLAVLLHALVPPDWDVQVLGTDVSGRALGVAAAARYGQRAARLVPPADRARAFHALPGGGCEVRPEVRRLVALRQHNLVTEPAPYRDGEVDLVLCRNVTIYFDRGTTRALVERFARVLRPGGYLLLGSAETLWQVTDSFDVVPLDGGQAFVYRRPDGAGRPAPVPVSAPAPAPAPAPVSAPARPRPTDRVPAPDRASGPDPADVVRAALLAGAYARAEAVAAAALAGDGLRADLHYLRGRALVELGRDRDAVRALRGALYLAPGHGLAAFLLGGALQRLGSTRAARSAYADAGRALAATPPDAGAPELGGRPAAELARLCTRLAAG